jgi:hypothetical protein
MKRRVIEMVGVLGLLAFILLPGVASAQWPPSPAAFVPFLDVRCYSIRPQPPIGVPLQLDHLNPYFQSIGLPPEQVRLQEPEQLCVPVMKNDNRPPDDVLKILEFIDWKCYGIEGPPLDIDVRLTQLNRVIQDMFGREVKVRVGKPQQLCVPVLKRPVVSPAPPPFPSDEVLKIIQWMDVKCYEVTSDQIARGSVRLTHLNPLLRNLPPDGVRFEEVSPAQLCVPVAKNKQFPSHEAYRLVAFSDVLCYKVRGRALNTELWLDHLNPVLREMGLPSERVKVSETEELCVPVAKEDFFPPEQ